MKISKFIEAVCTTKDTVRHYEELGILNPIRKEKNARDYSEKDIEDFNVIKELQNLGFTLKDIQIIFQIKRETKCNSDELISTVLSILIARKKSFEEELIELQEKMQNLEELITQISKIKRGRR
ncbi:MerR family transcriptional regulator [Rummeliibacillus sp. POC4]|uniref:MerR family transcriptional regulator n=1 Tax=Rummeliibacillus sp. POC4 TaxID=2305899 RepID=UPI000E675A68|nr:MerR family transcriptional regulator [Rummeliibacillus sp. POC4]RIJ63720.1 MerR family transcriptional regulator [Rummeliibacillus sp. POC4]